MVHYFGFRYVLSPCRCDVKKKACHLPRRWRRRAVFKRDDICCPYDWYQRLLTCLRYSGAKARVIILFVRRSLMKFYRTARLTAGAGSRHMRGGFYRGTYYLKKYGNMCWTHGNIRIYLWRCCRTLLTQKNSLGKMPTALVTAGKLEENTPHRLLTPRRARGLTSAGKRYADHPNYRSKLPCIVRVIRN